MGAHHYYMCVVGDGADVGRVWEADTGADGGADGGDQLDGEHDGGGKLQRISGWGSVCVGGGGDEAEQRADRGIDVHGQQCDGGEVLLLGDELSAIGGDAGERAE